MGSRNEATMLLIDCSESMSRRLESLSSHNTTRFEAARDIAWHFLARKAIEQRKTIEVGVAAFGTEETRNQLVDLSAEDYANVTEVLQLSNVSIEGIRTVKDLEQSSVTRGEVLPGLVVAMNMLSNRIQRRKVEANLYVLTDAGSQAEKLVEDLEHIAERLQSSGFSFTVVGFDFAADPEAVNEEELSEDEQNKLESEKMLRSLVNAASEKGHYIDASTFYSQICVLRNEPPRSAATKVPFEITPKLVIPAQYLALTMQAKKPALKRLNPDAPEEVLNVDRLHYDQDGGEVMLNERMKAYPYGSEYVPVDEDSSAMMKLEEDKASLKLICMQPESSVPRYHCMANSLALVGQRDSWAAPSALSALALALHEEKQVAIVRFVRRRNAQPELGMLAPNVSDPQRPYLVYNKLPFMEDAREYDFHSFANPARKEYAPSSEQRATALALVDSMMLQPSEPGAPVLRPVPNPELAAVYKLVVEKALDPHQQEVPLPSEDVLAPLRPDPNLLKHAAPAIDKFRELFPFKVVDKKKRKAVMTWAELCGEGGASGERDTEGGNKRACTGEEEPVDEVKGPTSVSSTRPQEDFEAMIKAGNVGGAVSSMKDYIHRTIQQAEEQEIFYPRALSAIQTLRKGAAEHKHGQSFNEFLADVKRKYKKGAAAEASFWQDVKATSLITTEEDSSVSVGAKEAKEFWSRAEVKEEQVDEEVMPTDNIQASYQLDADF